MRKKPLKKTKPIKELLMSQWIKWRKETNDLTKDDAFGSGSGFRVTTGAFTTFTLQFFFCGRITFFDSFCPKIAKKGKIVKITYIKFLIFN